MKLCAADEIEAMTNFSPHKATDGLARLETESVSSKKSHILEVCCDKS